LKQAGIDTVEEYQAKRGALFAYLTEDWFRLTRDQVDRTNSSRARVWSMWERVSAAFAEWTGGIEMPLCKPVSATVSFDLHKRMLVGNTQSIIAASYVGTGVVLDKHEFKREAIQVIGAAIDAYYDEERFDQRRFKFEVSGGSSCLPNRN
jgi:hypothetical protein